MEIGVTCHNNQFHGRHGIKIDPRISSLASYGDGNSMPWERMSAGVRDMSVQDQTKENEILVGNLHL